MSRMRIVHVTLMALVFLLSQNCDAGPRGRGRTRAKSKGVRFNITLDKSEYKKTDSIQVTLTLENNDKKPVYVNTRFYINKEDSPKKEREVYFIVTSPSGEKLPHRERSYETGLPKTDYFVLLKPGEEISAQRKCYLKGYFDIKDPGTYKITAVYQNVHGAEIGIGAFEGAVKSETVTMKIVE